MPEWLPEGSEGRRMIIGDTYSVHTTIRGMDVELGVFLDLKSAYDCVEKVGKKSTRRFRIYKTTTNMLEIVTAKDVREKNDTNG